MLQSFKRIDGLFGSIDCADWIDFKVKSNEMLRVASDAQLSQNYIFRGQGCSSWPLQSSFDRKNESLSPADSDVRYRRRMKLFEKNYAIYGDISSDRHTFGAEALELMQDSGIEALAQHYGLSTRLLDWSKSIYVAAFFAISNIDQCDTGFVSIWSLDISALNLFSDDHLEFIEDSSKGNVRNLWQMGSFTRNKTTMKRVEELFMNSSEYYTRPDDGRPLLIRFDLPVGCRPHAIDDLNMMRINSMTIFPGIEGVVRWIEEGGH